MAPVLQAAHIMWVGRLPLTSYLGTLNAGCSFMAWLPL